MPVRRPLRRPVLASFALAGLATLTACGGRVPATGGAEAAVSPAGERYDVLIAGGTVVDGTGAPGYAADVALRGDRIVRISRRPLDRSRAARVVDATGHVVAPGFVDMHAHIESLLAMRDAASSVRQGVTSIFGGQDGDSPWPLAAAYDSVDAGGAGLNVGYLVGHGTVREMAMGLGDRAPTAGELARMRELVAQGMGEGAWGLSSGLEYVPGTFATTDELADLAAVAGDSGGIYSSHIRDEGPGLLASVAEVAEVARRGRLTGNVTHMKPSGRRAWGLSGAALALIDSARAAGVDVTMDQYPYTATSTGLSLLVPTWALAGGDTAYARRAADPALRDSIRRAVAVALDSMQGGREPARVQFSRVRWDTTLEGRTLRDWAVRRGVEPTPANAAVLVLEAMDSGGAGCVYHVIQEDDVERIMRHPLTAVASDGSLSRPGLGHPHPRAYGTFVRVLGRYVRERRVLTLEDAVRRMTSLPAERLGIERRGRLAEGWYADVVVFDPATVADAATFERPHQYAVGVDYVLVNGRFAVDGGATTGVLAGRALRHVSQGR
jgi:N-acyl-D-amino-acid deacylase